MSPTDLQRFVSGLSARRASLEARLGSELSFDPAAMLAEITELTEQLLAADEELRAQNDELERTRAALTGLAAEQDRAFAASLEPLVLTDLAGIVLNSNRAARALFGEREDQVTAIRPITTKFPLDERPRVRSLISRAAQGSDPQAAELVVHRRGAVDAACTVEVRRSADPTGESGLLWAIAPHPTAQHPPAPHPAVTAASGLRLLTALSSELATTPVGELPATVVRLAIAAVPAAEHAALLLGRRRTDGTVVGWGVLACSDAWPRSCAEIEKVDGGPGITAVRSQRPVLAADTADERRWPRFSDAAVAQGFRSVLAAPMPGRNDGSAALQLFASAPHAYGEEDVALLTGFAQHAGTLLAARDKEQNLRVAIETRELIGQAVGILVERHRATAQQAFDMLVHVSQTRHQKLRQLAQILTETGDL